LENIHRQLAQKLEECGLPGDVQFSVRLVPLLAPDPSTGKFRRMSSQIGPPVELRAG